jgi:hypothetical protein
MMKLKMLMGFFALQIRAFIRQKAAQKVLLDQKRLPLELLTINT